MFLGPVYEFLYPIFQSLVFVIVPMFLVLLFLCCFGILFRVLPKENGGFRLVFISQERAKIKHAPAMPLLKILTIISSVICLIMMIDLHLVYRRHLPLDMLLILFVFAMPMFFYGCLVQGLDSIVTYQLAKEQLARKKK